MNEFEPIASETTDNEQYDLLSLVPQKELKCLDKGFVRLVDVMPRLAPVGKTGDYAIVQAARVSYGDGTKKVSEDRGLIRYLMRHSHTSPTEQVEFKFHCKAPIFVARQWFRHRMCSANEASGRYSILKDEFYFPAAADVSIQSTTNKQGGETSASSETSNLFIGYLEKLCDESYGQYESFLNDHNIAREQARMCLPVNLYTEWYWKIDLHNLLHFIALRSDSHAQYEIQVFSNAILELIKPLVPFTIEAWEDYHFRRGGLLLTRLEAEALKKVLNGIDLSDIEIDSDNKREKQEWKEKLKRLK